MTERPLLIVDGDNLAHRAYHSYPKETRGEGGRPINAIVGFFSMLARVWQEEQPRGIFVAWDTLGVGTYRNELWPAYQGGREFDPEIVEQLAALPELCQAFRIATGQGPGHEADDYMASAARAEEARGGTALVLTTDRDTYQLVNERVTVLSPQRKTRELARIGPQQVVDYFGVAPELVPDFKALSGDSSDRIPGVKGIGPVAASGLLKTHGSLDGVCQAWGDTPNARLALMFREVARMRCDLPVDLPTENVDWQSGAAALRKIGADGLADRLADIPLEDTPLPRTSES
ncbi:MAG: 5'-3' exonuclease [Fimbriimonadaceae bacterium]|nr:5'-3' exonuclease [Fimbriimonadaceae bacterium]QYK54699.1 MAG: 5'-3' exonuclease [Fimbriimonadaceae bacterium]